MHLSSSSFQLRLICLRNPDVLFLLIVFFLNIVFVEGSFLPGEYGYVIGGSSIVLLAIIILYGDVF
jgi:hypothetical protein